MTDQPQLPGLPAPPRPLTNNPVILGVGARKVMQRLMENGYGFDTAGDALEECIADLVNEMPLEDDGYALAQSLERCGWLWIDASAVAVLDDAAYFVRKAHDEAVKAWVLEHKISPPFAVGSVVLALVRHQEKRCTITRCDEAAATYHLLADDATPAERAKNSRWIVTYEDCKLVAGPAALPAPHCSTSGS